MAILSVFTSLHITFPYLQDSAVYEHGVFSHNRRPNGGPVGWEGNRKCDTIESERATNLPLVEWADDAEAIWPIIMGRRG